MWLIIFILFALRRSPAAQTAVDASLHDPVLLPMAKVNVVAKLEGEQYNILAQQAGLHGGLALDVFQDKQYEQFHTALDKTVKLGPSVAQQMDASLNLALSDFGENPGAGGYNSSIMGESHLI